MQRRKPPAILIVLAIICCGGKICAQPVVAGVAIDSTTVESFDDPEQPFSSDTDSEWNDVACGDEIGVAGLIEPDARRRGRWSVVTELTVLLPSYSTETLATANEHPILGPRASLGWESEAGFGIRARGWGFESPVDVEQAPSPYPPSFYYPTAQMISHQIDFSGSRFDLDFYKRMKHSTGDFAIGASVTAAHLTLREKYVATSTSYGNYYSSSYIIEDYGNDSLEVSDPGQYYIQEPAPIIGIAVSDYDYYYYFPPSSPLLDNLTSTNTSYANGVYTTTYQGGRVLRNRGAGLGLLMEGSHRFYETPHNIWSIFGRGRVAYLIGRWDEPTSSTLQQGDGNMTIGEAALGLEYRRPFRYADLTVQCSFEVQSWSVSLADRVNLAGVTTGVGLSW